MGRKFTENEVKAFSKNRHEEKILQEKLRKLKEEFGVFHDVTQKQRSLLLHESKELKMTSGQSPVPASLDFRDEKFQIYNRIKRPWAYSTMETTYNAAYQESQIPLPKPKGRNLRSRSVSSNRSAISSPRRLHFENINGKTSRASDFSIMSTDSKCVTPRIDSDYKVTTEMGAMASTGNDKQSDQSDTAAITTQAKETPKTGDLISDDLLVRRKTSNMSILLDHKTADFQIVNLENSTANGGNFLQAPLDTSADSVKTKQSRLPICLTLPPLPVSGKDSNSDQGNKSRSKSRVSFSSSPTRVAAESETEDVTGSEMEAKECSITGAAVQETFDLNEDKTTTPVNTESESRNLRETVIERPHTCGPMTLTNSGANGGVQRSGIQRPHTVVIMDSSAQVFEEEEEDTGDYVLYKGQKLRNYIRPQDRYKLDPVIVKRRQLKMDKLAKESITYLERVNHENIRVEIAFPRSSRKRLLDQLVMENNSSKSKINIQSDSDYLQTRIQEFIDSVTRYIERTKSN